MVTFDTEDNSQGIVTIINFYDGNKHITYKGKNCRYKAWDYLHEIAPDTIWAVNAEYDLINLFGPWLTKLCSLQYAKSGLLRATYKDAKIIFLDTLRHWPASVEEMGKVIGLPKLSMPHLGCECDDCVEYCRRDTEITWRFVSEMSDRYESLGLDTIRSTLPSMALQLFKKFYVQEFPVISPYHKKYLRKGYFGGRVEIYRMGKINGKINHYDVNSLFPSVMIDYSYPDLNSLYTTNKPDFNREGIFRGKVFVPYTYFPCLPFRANEIIFPTGYLEGSWAYPEIRQLLEDGGNIVHCEEALEFDESENPFDTYVKFCYKKRLESKHELDKTFWKLMLNSLYGKFGQNSDLTIISNDEEKVLRTGDVAHANVIWSAYVTSYARLRLLSYLRSCASVFYTDTDSLFTFDNLPVSSELGALKLEGNYMEVEFIGNKLYCLDDNVRAKGVPRKYAGDFYRTGKAVYRRPYRLRESRRRGVIPNVWNDITKEHLKKYSKRKILSDGSTEPWNYPEYRHLISKGIL